MRIDFNTGFIEIKRNNDKVNISIGCDNFNQNGIRVDSTVNSVAITDDQFREICLEIFEKNKVE